MGEDAGAGKAAAERGDEVNGVDLDSFAAIALAELAAGGAFEDELERLAVDGRPFGDEVGHQAAVVVGGEEHFSTGRHADVDTVSPDVTGESHVARYLRGFQPTGGAKGKGRKRMGGGVRQRPSTARGPTVASAATSSPLVRCERSRICSAFMPSTQ